MKTLELQKMENIQGGVFGDCADASISLALTGAGAFLVGGPVGAGLFAAAFIWGSVDLAEAC